MHCMSEIENEKGTKQGKERKEDDRKKAVVEVEIE